MNTQTHITKGRAVIVPNHGIRCRADHSQPKVVCNRLIVKFNKLAQIAGSFRCNRCKQDIDVELR